MKNNSSETEIIKFDLERLIDKFSVHQILELIGEICSEKAQHETWQDEQLARKWDDAAQVCFQAAQSGRLSHQL